MRGAALLPDGASCRGTRPLAELLPYVTCGSIGDFGPVHLLDDDTIGFALEFNVPVVDTQVDGEAAVASLIDQALRALPPDVHWQWFVLSSSFVEPQLQRYLAQPGHDALGKACALQFAERWRGAQQAGFFPSDPEINFSPRSQSIVLALKSAPAGLRPGGPVAWLRPAGELRQRTAGFIDAARALQGTLASHGVCAVTVGADRLANLVADLLFPWRRFERPPLDCGLHGVRDAVSSQGRIDPIEPGGFRTIGAGGPAHHRVASMLWHPRAVAPGMLNALMLMRPCQSIVVSGRALASAGSAVRLKAQGLLNARSANRFNEVETQARAQALGDVERRLFSEGEKLIEGRLQVHVIEASAQAADEAARAVCDVLRGHDIEAGPEEDIGATLILRGCLPFTLYEATDRKLRRRRRFLSRDFADLHPAGGAWTGLPPGSGGGSGSPPAPIVMYGNPAGEPLFIDPTKAERNPHALVVGQSGSGKSFFVHDYLLHLWRLPDVRLYLMSIKPDYRKLALLLGRYVELNLDCAESLNPFAGAPTPENQARWVAALALMLTEGRADRPLTREQEIALQEASLAASAQHWDSGAQRAASQTRLEDVCVHLERRGGALGRDLAFQLLPYRRGPYRRLFNAPRTLGAADRFVFFNLGSILRQPCSAAACFCVFNLVDEVMHDPALRAVPKGLIADEAWALAQNPFAAAILERSLKAYRSLGGFALPIVQDPRDLDTPAGRVMLVNTATKIVLPMDRSGQDELRRFVRLNDREFEIVRDLRLVKRRYSEFFVSIEGVHSARGLLIPDPLRYAIATTDPADEAELERLHQKTGSMLEAVRTFARELPYGVAAAGQHGAALARWLAWLSLSAAALAAFLFTASRPPVRPAPASVVAQRTQITEQALGLLAAARLPDPVRGAADPAHRAGVEAGALDGRVPRPMPELPAAPASMAHAAAANGRPGMNDAAGPAAASAPNSTGAAGSVKAKFASLAADAARRRAPLARPPIPDQIEGLTPADGAPDPLLAMALQADLVESDPRAAPLVLVEVRDSNRPPQARLRSIADGAPGGEAWFEPGDLAAPGWTVVSVGPGSATLMSSLGLRVRLALRGQDDSTAAQPADPAGR